jgi:hypothetical protein
MNIGPAPAVNMNDRLGAQDSKFEFGLFFKSRRIRRVVVRPVWIRVTGGAG